jgi:hypothetical protein
MSSDRSQHSGHKSIDVAEAIVDNHLLLLPCLVPPNPSEPSP